MPDRTVLAVKKQMMKRLILYVCAFFCGVSVPSQAQTLPYRNPALSVEERVEDLLGRMTLEEKVAQLRHIHSENVFDGQKLSKENMETFCRKMSFGFVEGLPLYSENCRDNFMALQKYMVEETRLGIPVIITTEALHGMAQDGATIFPQNIALGSTFNPELAYRKSSAISEELHTAGIRQVLAPCIDVVRDLRWGRVEESYGEDPWLCAQMGLAETKGYWNHHISPMLKHYGAHGAPVGGLNLASVDCGMRDLIDVYLKPFEVIVKGTDVKTIMSSYNSRDRVPNSASKFLMTELLRNRWGFKGLVYSDWAAVSMLKSFHHVAEDDEAAALLALTAGLDVEASSNCYLTLVEAVREGRCSMEAVNQAVGRVLRVKMELGLFEHPYGMDGWAGPIRDAKKIALAREMADESTVLLKNEGGLLPLDINKLKSIAVIGPNADQVQFGDYSWSKDNKDGVTPLQGIKAWAGDRVKVNYAYGCDLVTMDDSQIDEAVCVARRSDVVVLCCGSSSTRFIRPTPVPSTTGEGIDLHDISLTGCQERLIRAVAATGKPVVLVLVAGKPFAIPWEKEDIPAILAQWYAGEQAGNSLADILFGKVNPSGRLNFSFPQSTGHLPVYYNHLPSDKGYYKKPGAYGNPGRDYVFSSPAPLWAFGHGLSYTTFNYETARTDKQQYKETDTIRVSVQIKNAGMLPGKEVVQVYVRDLVSSVVTPVCQLKAFAKPLLAPGETKEIVLCIPISELALTDEQGNRFFEPGLFDIEIGAASDDIRHKLKIVVGDYTISENTTAKVTPGWKKPIGREIEISGIVRDVQATPIENVSIYSVYTGKKLGFTDNKGTYILKVVSDDRLVFKCEGYKSEVIDIKGSKTINVKLGAE